MQVIIYVPQGGGADRTRAALEREVRRRGHAVIGTTSDPMEAWVARNSGRADRVAGRPEHLVELGNLPMWSSINRPWAMGIPARATTNPLTAVAALAAGSGAWVVSQFRHRPVRAGSVAIALAGVTAALAVAFGPVDEAEMEPPAALPPSSRPSPSAPASPGSPPASVPSRPPAVPTSPGDTPTPTGETPGEAPAGDATSTTEPEAPVSPSATPTRTRTPTKAPPSPSATPPITTPPAAQPPETERKCLVNLRLVIVNLRALCAHPNGQPA